MMCRNSRWRQLSRVLCLTLAVWMCGAVDAQAKKEAPLNVGSFNIRCNTTADGENAWPYRKDRVMALIEFHGYDIIGVQEARPEQMADMKQMSGYASVGVGRDGKQGGEFSAIFYRTDRIQLLDSGTFWLSETPDVVSKGWDAALNRICTWAKMKDKQTKKVFYFFNTHFDHMGKQARRESARLLSDRIAAMSNEYPVMCTGDFNSGDGSEPVEIIKERLKDAEKVSLTKPYVPGWSFTEFSVAVPEKLMKNGKIDFLFVNDLVVVQKFGILTDSDGKNHPSDHFPVFATVVLQ